ncbi:hypothetical protein Tco_0557974 [Tanacetum coccineum]
MIRRIHQLDTTYQTFYPEQRIEFYSLNNVSVLPNNTAYSVNSIRRTDIQQTYTAYSRQLNTAYLSSDTVTVVSGNRLTRAMTNVTTELIIREILEKAVTNSNSKLTETWIDLDELCKKIFKDLQCHAFSRTEEEDVVDHIADFLKILDPIKITIFDTNQLRINIFPLSLTGDAKIWWLNEQDNKITAWGMLAGRFFCKYFPLSRDGKNYIENTCNKDSLGYYEFMACMDSKHDDIRIDRVTKSTLGHAWVYRLGAFYDPEDDTVSSDEEWEEHEYRNPPNISFPKPYLNTSNERDKCYHKENNGDTNKLDDMVLSGAPHSEELTNGQLNKKVCKVEKFEVHKYSIGDSEEFLAICTRECNSWAQTVNGVSMIYHDIFQKKDDGWTILLFQEAMARLNLTQTIKIPILQPGEYDSGSEDGSFTLISATLSSNTALGVNYCYTPRSDQAEEGPTNFALMAYSSTSSSSSTNSECYNAVPPPYTGNFMPPKSNLVYPSLDDFVDVNESVSKPVVEKPTVETNEPKTARKENLAPNIKDWVSESEEDDEPKFQTAKPNFTKIEFVKPITDRKPVKQIRQDIYSLSFSPSRSPRGNKRNWNQKMSQKLGNDFEMFNKACHVCGSFDHLKNDCNNWNNNGRFAKLVWTNVQRVNKQNFSKLTYPSPKKNMVPRTVLTRSGPITLNTARPVNTVQHNTSLIGIVKDVIDSGCSRHMAGNKSYLTYYKEIDGGFVAFGDNSKGGKITRKGKIRTSKLDFEDVYFVKELKFNLFSVSQMCDKKNSVLFTDTGCVVLSPDFKLTDESHVLLKVPRKDNMYSVDLKNVVLQGGLTCLFVKATPNESNL